MSELALRLIEECKKTKAKSLDLGHCGLTEVPESVRELIWLEELNFANGFFIIDNTDKWRKGDRFKRNHLVKLPSWFNELQQLRTLKINGEFGDKWSLMDLSILKNFIHLQTLDFSYTNVSDLSPISNLANLLRIDFYQTNVLDVGPLTSLTSLTKIDGGHTMVSNLYPLISFIEKGIPVRIDEGHADLSYGIYLEKCPIINPPIEIAKQGNEAILNYFQEKEQQGTVKGCEAKMLLVGEGGSGKTSLMRRLYQTTKPLPEENESTKGIDIHRHDFKMADGSNFRLNVWDFGGQEIYHATHQFFLTKRSLYILLDDTRKDHKTVHDEGFKYWLEAVDLLGGHSPVLIFQNEKSDRSKQIDLGGIKGKFDNVQGVWQGNLEHPGTADKLREAVEHFAKNLSHVGEELPAKWVSIRAELEEMSKTEPYISQQEYFKVYGRHLEFDRTKALHLSQYLHDLGVFLHFQDDALLARTLILQNNWATEAVFKMLDDETVKGKLGRFTEADCQRVWAASTWADMHPELLALMQKFELCYVLPDAQPKTWLVPQLLPPSKPGELAKWEQPGDLVLRYRYEFLPKGLVSRLMVRQHRFVPRPDMAWTSGVLFERDGSQVLVEIPAKGGEIALRARGHERKELLSVISADLDALNETFHGLPDRVSRLIPCNCVKCQTLTESEFFEQKQLLQFKRDGIVEWPCSKSYKMVNVLELLDGVSVKKLPGWAWEKKIAVSEENITQIRDLIQEGDTQAALELFKKINPKEATILLGTFSELSKKHSRGVLKEEDFLREKTKINSGLLDLLDT